MSDAHGANEQRENLARLSGLIAQKRDSLPPFDYRDLAAWRRYDEALSALGADLEATEGAVIRSSCDYTSIRLAGIRATSTQGLIGALGNWRTAAAKRIGGAA